jgi:SsrA-binding protein
MARQKSDEKKVVATHHKARQYFEILDTFEAGISLMGPEVKSLRLGRASLDGCYGRHNEGELFLFNFYIPPYAFNTATEPLDPRRSRKLLLHKAEVDKIINKLTLKGLTLVPLEVYFKNGWAKVAVGIARGKNTRDKRADLKKRTLAREAEKSFKGSYRG